MGKRKKAWQEFEDLVAEIQRELAPNAIVEQNQRLPGSRSGTSRQIDICIRSTVGQYALLIVIDCKDHGVPIDVPRIGSFIDLVEDVGAHKGAMVSSKGFTAAAKTRAKDAGLDLFDLVDAKSERWRSYVTAPVVVVDFRLKGFSLNISYSGPEIVVPEDAGGLILYRADGSTLEKAGNLILDRWYDDTIPKEEGDHDGVLLAKEAAFLKAGDQLIPARVTAMVRVETVRFFGQVPLVDVRGLHDAIEGGLHTRGFMTDQIDMKVVEAEWARLDPDGALAVRPLLTLVVSSTYPREPLTE